MYPPFFDVEVGFSRLSEVAPLVDCAVGYVEVIIRNSV